jgi:hypothetical protein
MLVTDLQQSEFADTKAASSRERVNKLRRLRDGFGFHARTRADGQLFMVCENTQTSAGRFLSSKREMINRGGI